MRKFTKTVTATDGPEQHDSQGKFNVPFPVNQLTVILGTAINANLVAYDQYILPPAADHDYPRDKIEAYLRSLGLQPWAGTDLKVSTGEVHLPTSKLTKKATATDGPKQHDDNVGWFRVQFPFGQLTVIDGTAYAVNEAGYDQYILPSTSNFGDVVGEIEAYLVSLGMQKWTPPG